MDGHLDTRKTLSLFDPFFNLIYSNLESGNYLVNGTCISKEPVYVIDVNGFNVVFSSYDELVWGRNIEIRKFMIFDSFSQLVSHVNKCNKEWEDDWTLHIKSPSINTFFQKIIFTLYCNANTTYIGNRIIVNSLNLNTEVADRIGEVLLNNSGMNFSRLPSDLFHRTELDYVNRRTAWFIANYNYNTKLTAAVEKHLTQPDDGSPVKWW
nr:hypothetical protein [Ganoderma leucocontextum]